MNQRRPGSGRPSGTDGSDFSYRMVVDSRYKKVGQFKSRLSVLIFTQAIIQLFGGISLFLSTRKLEEFDSYAVSSLLVWFLSLFVGELGRKRSRINLLRIFLIGTSVASVISMANALRSSYVQDVMKDFSSWGTSNFELVKVTAVLLGVLAQMLIIHTTTSLVHNMAPPKRAS